MRTDIKTVKKLYLNKTNKTSNHAVHELSPIIKPKGGDVSEIISPNKIKGFETPFTTRSGMISEHAQKPHY